MSSNLQPNQFESILFTYGYLEDGLILSRATVQKMAEISVGSQGRHFEEQRGQLCRILSTRLEDDSPADHTKGRVIAICEPIEPPSRPYHPQGMETK
jgi:hypothetical protein